jgi:hypothetical protein
MSCGGDNFVVPGANPCNNGGGGGTAGVTTLNGFEGAVNITAGNPSIGVSNEGGAIVLTATGLQAVDSLNGVSGVVNIINGANTSVSTVGTDITINVPTPVTSINSRTGPITFQGLGDTIVTNTGNAFFFNTPTGVLSLNAKSGAVAIAGGGGTTVTTAGQGITITTPVSVTGVNGITGPVIINATGATTITQVGDTITINTPTSGAQSQLVKSETLLIPTIPTPVGPLVYVDFCSVPMILTTTSDVFITLTLECNFTGVGNDRAAGIAVNLYYNINGGPFSLIKGPFTDIRPGYGNGSFVSALTFNCSVGVTALTAGNYVFKAAGLSFGSGGGVAPIMNADSVSLIALGNLA